MNKSLKNLLEIVSQATRHLIRNGLETVASRTAKRSNPDDSLSSSGASATENLTFVDGSPPVEIKNLDSSGRRLIGLRQHRLLLVAGLSLALVIALAAWFRSDANETASASPRPSWLSEYLAARKAVRNSEDVQAVGPLTERASEHPVRTLLLDQLRADQLYFSKGEIVASRSTTKVPEDWVRQEGDALAVYLVGLSEEVDRLLTAGRYKEALELSRSFESEGLFRLTLDSNVLLRLRIAAGRALLMSGSFPNEGLVGAIREGLKPSGDSSSQVLQALVGLFLVEYDILAGRFPQARERLEGLNKMLEDKPGDAQEFEYDLILMRSGGAWWQLGDFQHAKKHLSILLARPEKSERCHVFLDASLTMADIEIQEALFSQAEQTFQRAKACLQSQPGPNAFYMARLQNGYGVLLTVLGRLDQAGESLLFASDTWRQVLPAGHPWLGMLSNNLGAWYRSKGDDASAYEAYESAAAVWRTGLGELHPYMATYHNNIAEMYMLQSRLDDVSESLATALKIREKAFGDQHPWTALVVSNIGELSALEGDSTSAYEKHSQALSVRQKVLGLRHPDTAMSLNNLGTVLYGSQEYRKAELNFNQALEINRELLGTTHPRTILTMTNLGATYVAVGEFESAKQLLQQVVDHLIQAPGSQSLLSTAMIKLAEAESALGELAQAEKHYIAVLDLAAVGDRTALMNGSKMAYRALVEMYSQRKNSRSIRILSNKYPWARG